MLESKPVTMSRRFEFPVGHVDIHIGEYIQVHCYSGFLTASDSKIAIIELTVNKDGKLELVNFGPKIVAITDCRFGE